MKKTVALPVLQAKEGRETSALEKSLIRFFERELEVKLTRREMWRSVRFVASLFVLLLALSTGEPLLALPALALGLRLSGRSRHNLPFYGERRCAIKSHTIEFTRDDLVVRITRYPAGEPGKSPSVEIEVESSGLPRSFVWFDREPQLFAFKEMLEEYIETFRPMKDDAGGS